MNTLKIDSSRTLMVAHRGVSGLEKENTLAAFIAAGNRSYFGIETDVHRTADGKYVCIHDDQTGRVAIDDYKVEETDFATLRSLVLTDIDGEKGRIDLRIPTLQEYVQICKKYDKVGVLELKNAFEREDIKNIIDIIRAEDYLQGIIFISFTMENLLFVREILPDQPCQFLTSKYTDEMADALVLHRLDLDIHYSALNEERIRGLHARGIRINCWTVNEPEDAIRLSRLGVEYITSNIIE